MINKAKKDVQDAMNSMFAGDGYSLESALQYYENKAMKHLPIILSFIEFYRWRKNDEIFARKNKSSVYMSEALLNKIVKELQKEEIDKDDNQLNREDQLLKRYDKVLREYENFVKNEEKKGYDIT